jgi:arylsulfatase A-like enzyme
MPSRLRVSESLAAAVLFALLMASGCRPAPQPPRSPAWFFPYRFDDRLAEAKVAAAPVSASAPLAPTVRWDFSDAQITWRLLRGRMGFRPPGQMVLKGDGATPVVLNPEGTSVDWSLYETVAIRMAAEGGREIKIRIGPFEYKRPLAPPLAWRVYRFDLDITTPTFGHPLAIMPTDDLYAPVAIDSIELIPRRAAFDRPVGRQFLGKQEEYRNVIYVHTPATLDYEVQVPEGARLQFGVGIAGRAPVNFRIRAGPAQEELWAASVSDPGEWQDAAVDLGRFAGRSLRLVFEADASQAGAVGLWANPLVTSSRLARKPNILIYLICSLRPDHTSLHGYARQTTPFLKSLGASGIVFEDAHAQAPWTKASVPSLLTSLHAWTLDLRTETGTVPPGARTLAERLRQAGYVTASAVTNPFAGRVSGLDRGCDYLFEYPAIHRVRNEASDRGTDSAALNRVLLPWLERHRHAPFFLYAHTTDPHAPYRPPPGFEQKWAEPAETTAFDRTYAALHDLRQYGGGAVFTREAVKARGLDPEGFLRQAIDRYDGEIAFCDSSLAALFERLKQLGIADDTLLVVVSDHGEEFWDHGFTGHGHSLYRELIHALWVMWNPKLLPRPARLSQPVALIDLVPTLLELIDLPVEGVVEGQSLLPLLRGEPFQRKAYVAASKPARPNPRGFVPENAADSFMLLDERWKLIYRPQAERAGLSEAELYDRAADPAERSNAAARFPAETARLTEEVRRWISAREEIRKLVGRGREATLDPNALERLRTLGYIGGSAPPKR